MLLSVESVSTYYGSIRALSEVSLEVAEGEIVALVGANGAGKTTLLHTISGLLPAREGVISFDGRDIANADPTQIVKYGIAHVPEHRQVFGDMTVYENLLLGAYHRHRKAGKVAINEDIEWVFGVFPRLEERKAQLAGTMSGGEQQMLAVARGMMSRPKLMLFDEPSLGLGPLIVKTVFEAIDLLRDEGMTILLVEQNARAALRSAQRGYVLETGEVAFSGAASDLLDDPRVREAYLGGAQA